MFYRNRVSEISFLPSKSAPPLFWSQFKFVNTIGLEKYRQRILAWSEFCLRGERIGLLKEARRPCYKPGLIE